MSSKTLDFECALVTGGAGGLVSVFVNAGIAADM
jgi:hypothetical protein